MKYEIKPTILDLNNDFSYYETQVKTLELCESLKATYIYVEESLEDIINTFSFSLLIILHSSITPRDLVDSIQTISPSLQKTTLPIKL